MSEKRIYFSFILISYPIISKQSAQKTWSSFWVKIKKALLLGIQHLFFLNLFKQIVQ
jgi:hypothetical protein